MGHLWKVYEKFMEHSWKIDEFDGRLMGNGRNFRGHLWEIYGISWGIGKNMENMMGISVGLGYLLG